MTDPINERWVGELLQTPRRPEWRRIRIWRRSSLPVSGDSIYRLTIKRQRVFGRGGMMYLWYAEDARDVIAAVTAWDLENRGHVLEIGATAVRSGYRQQGIYRSILRELRRLFKNPIESDFSRTVGAETAWRRAGAVDAERDGKRVMRINPSRSRSKSSR